MSLQGCIVYLLLVYGTKTHKACNPDPVYLVTWNPFTPLFRREWTYVAMVHSSSHQAMTRASDQLHTTSFCSPPVLSNTRDTRDTQNAHCFCSKSYVDHNLETNLSRRVFLFNMHHNHGHCRQKWPPIVAH
jgi:hypothetical protein